MRHPIAINFGIGLALCLLGWFLFEPLAYVVPSYVRWLDETLLVLALAYAVAAPFLGRGTRWMIPANLLAIWMGYSLLGGLWYLATSSTWPAEVRYAGTDERRAGAEIAFIVDLADQAGKTQSYLVRDVMLPPWIWQRDSGDDRRELRAAQGKTVCVWTAGVRIPVLSLMPYVLEVYPATECQP